MMVPWRCAAAIMASLATSAVCSPESAQKMPPTVEPAYAVFAEDRLPVDLARLAAG